MNTLPKSERLKGKAAVSALLSKGRWGFTRGLKYCYIIDGTEEDSPRQARILDSVPKKLFKRAVKRNLLKRRLRESYRTQKDLLQGCPADIMFIYNTGEVMDFGTIREQVASILTRINDERQL